MDNKYEGIKLEESLRIIFGKKLVFLFVTIIVAVLFFVGFYVFYNKSSTEYTATFNYSYDELNSGTYYDGSTFMYSSLISKSTLETIKENDSEFSDIDVDTIVSDSGISLDKETDADTEEVTFTLTVKESYFSSSTIASDFIDAIINYPINTILENSESATNDSYLELYDDAFYYSSKVNDLINQYDLLESKYETLEDEFGDIAVNSNGDILSDYYNSLEAYFSDYDLDEYYSEAVNNGYVDDFSTNKTAIIYKCNSLISDYLENEETINALNDEIDEIKDGNSSSSDLDSYNEVLTTLISDNITIKIKLTSIIKMFLNNDYTTDALEEQFPKLVNNSIYTSAEIESIADDLNTSGKSDFSDLIATIEEKLEDYTTAYNEAEYYILENNISYTSSITVSGNIGLPVSAVASIVVGLILAACVNIAIYQIEKNNMRKKVGDNSEPEKIK